LESYDSLALNLIGYRLLIPSKIKFSRILFFIIVNLIGIPIFSQQNYTKSDSTLIYEKLDQADELDFNGELDSALMIVEWVHKFSRKINMSRGLGYAQLKRADLLLKKSLYHEITGLLDEGYLIGNHLKDSLMMGLSHTQRAQFYKAKGDMESSISALKKAIACFSSETQQLYIGISYNDLAHAYSRQSDFEKAIYFGYEAIKSFEKINDLKELGNAYGNMAVNYYKLNDKKTAIDLFKKALAIQEKIGDTKRIASTLGNLVVVYTPISLDSAIYYQEKALPIVEKLGLLSTQANSLNQTGSLYDRKGEHQKALLYFRKSLKLNKEISDPGKLANAYINCALQYDKLNDSLAAEFAFDSSFYYAIVSKDKLFLQNYQLTKSKFYQSRNNSNLALEHYKKSVVLKDSIFNEKSNSYISELNIKYETEKKELLLSKANEERKTKELELKARNKELEIAKLINRDNEQELLLAEKEQEIQSIKINELASENEKKELVNQTQLQNVQILEKENELKEKQIHQKNILILSGILAFMAIVLISYLLFNRFKLKKRLEQNEEQNKIRDKIAADLHDEVGSSLTSIHLMSLITEKQFISNQAKLSENLHDIQLQAKKIQQNMSDIVWAIRSENDKIESLSARILEFAHKNLEAKNIRLKFKADPKILDQSLDLEQRKELVLICKELINNVIKHANATEVQIEMVKSNSNIILCIKDNGIGFDSAQSTGTGLKSIHNRAKNMGGHFKIQRENELTVAYVSFPSHHHGMPQ